jgi:polyferredoxin
MNKLLYEKSVGVAFFAWVFVMMCVLRLWFTLYLVFGLAVTLTFFHKKRSYCRHMCPIALAQDTGYSEKNAVKSFDPGIMKRVGLGVVAVFWALLLGLSGFHVAVGTTAALWFRILILMWGSLLGSLLIQELYGKRIWCRYFCPLSRLLDFSVGLARQSDSKNR